MTLGKLQANSVISAYQNSTNQTPHASEEAKKLGLKDEQTVGKNESRYELDGTLKEEYAPIGMKRTDKLEKSGEAEESLFNNGKDDKAIGHNEKHDGFDKEIPDCQCETCKNRRYKDDSDDSCVSFVSLTVSEADTAVSSGVLYLEKRAGVVLLTRSSPKNSSLI